MLWTPFWVLISFADRDSRAQGRTHLHVGFSPSNTGEANTPSSRGQTENNADIAIKVEEALTAEGHKALGFIQNTDFRWVS